jgi:hypothetical protein
MVLLATIRGHVQLVQPFPGGGHTQKAPGVGDDKIDRLRRHHLGRHHQVAFVLSLLIVDNDEKFASFEVR